MRKILFILLFCLPMSVSGQEYSSEYLDRSTACTVLTIRFTTYLTLAQVTKKESDFKTLMYDQIKEFDIDRDSKMLLAQLIDLAWIEKNKDPDLVALSFYRVCLKTYST